MEVLNEIDVPSGPIMSTNDLANDDHVKLREMYVELDHPQRGKWYNLGCPIKLSDSRWRSSDRRCWASIPKKSSVTCSATTTARSTNSRRRAR